MAPVEPATARVQRLLTLIPWLQNRPGITWADAAAGLGIDVEQLRSDLDLIWMCGYGQMPGELIEVDHEGETIVVSNADVVARPLRLGVDEAVTLLAGLRALADSPGITETDAINRAIAKLETATGTLAEATKRVRVQIDDGTAAATLQRLREALDAHRRVRLRYLVPSRDEVTERDVDPMRLVNLDARWYLEGWCHRAGDTRLFRVDRVEALEVLDVDGTPPADARERDLRDGSYVPGEADLRVRLRLAPQARWVHDYYPVTDVTEADDGSSEVTVSTGDAGFVERLVLRLGGEARVLEPADLATRVADWARAALRAYGREG